MRTAELQPSGSKSQKGSSASDAAPQLSERHWLRDGGRQPTGSRGILAIVKGAGTPTRRLPRPPLCAPMGWRTAGWRSLQPRISARRAHRRPNRDLISLFWKETCKIELMSSARISTSYAPPLLTWRSRLPAQAATPHPNSAISGCSDAPASIRIMRCLCSNAKAKLNIGSTIA